jgi:uncharacterized protein YndB with AHSA1/START domain
VPLENEAPWRFARRFSNSFPPGSRWRFSRHAPDGSDYKNECIFLEVLESELVNSSHLEPAHDFQTMVFAGEGARN